MSTPPHAQPSPLADSSNSQRRMLSCYPCYWKKVRCSKDRPSCLRCTAGNYNCVWPGEGTVPEKPVRRNQPPQPRPSSTRKSSVETEPPKPHKSQRREPPPTRSTSKLAPARAPSPPAVSEPKETVQTAPSPVTWHDGWDLRGGTAAEARVEPTSALGYCERLFDLDELLSASSNIAKPYANLTASTPDEDEVDASAELPSDAARLVDVYNDRVNLLYPLFATGALRTLIDSSASTELKSDERALVLLVCANAARVSQDDDRGRDFFASAISLLAVSPAASPTTIRAHLLRCIYLQDAHRPHDAFLSLAAASNVVQVLGAPSNPGPLSHHLHRLSLLHRFLTGGSTSLASSPPSAALDYPTLTSTTSIQVASYAFTAFLEQLLQSGEGNGKQNSALAAKLRKWAPLPPALSAEVRKGNAIGTRVQYEYIILTRLILVVRAAPFVQPLSEEEGAAAVKDAEELLIAVGGLVEDGAGVGGLVCFAAFVAVVVSAVTVLLGHSNPLSTSAKASLMRSHIIFSSPSLSDDPLAAQALAFLRSLKPKLHSLSAPAVAASPLGSAQPFAASEGSAPIEVVPSHPAPSASTAGKSPGDWRPEWLSLVSQPTLGMLEAAVKSRWSEVGWQKWVGGL